MRSFKLTDEVAAEGFSGGTVVASPAGYAFDVGAALTGSGGDIDNSIVISTDHPGLAGALAGFFGLEECEVPPDAVAIDVPDLDEAPVSPEPPPTLQNPPDQPGVAAEIPAEHVDESAVTDPTVDPTSSTSSKSKSRTSTASSSGDTTSSDSEL